MKATIEGLKDSYKIGMTAYEESRIEAREVIDLYNDRQYTSEQVATLNKRGQPVESFNVVKLMTHALLGFFNTVANDIQVKPLHKSSTESSAVLNDTVSYILDRNKWSKLNMKLKMDMMWTGYSVVYEKVTETGSKDIYGRSINNITLEHCPALQFVMDPMSKADDYSDARFLHRVIWMHEDACKRLWPRKWKELIDKQNIVNDREAEYFRANPSDEDGEYNHYEKYQIIHTVIRDGDKFWECIWSGETMLEKKEVSFSKVKFPYRITKANNSDVVEHYGLFREVIESQKAINQALLQIQLLVNTSRAIVETTAVEDVTKFREAFSRVNSVIEVTDIAGIRIENMSQDVASQYTIIDRGLDRIKAVLGVNDSFLGQAYASDSGRKVQIQKQASYAQLTWFVSRIELMHELLGWDLVHLIQQYYTATQILSIADPLNGQHWIEINKPLQNPDGTPIFAEVLDPETGKPETDEYGAILMAPINSIESGLSYSDVDVNIESVNFSNAEEQNQLLFETFLQGPVGQSLLQMNPGGYMQIAAMQTREYGSKHSPEISQILMDTAEMVSQGQINPALAMAGGDMGAILGGVNGGSTGNTENGPSSQRLQVPTKFNGG